MDMGFGSRTADMVLTMAMLLEQGRELVGEPGAHELPMLSIEIHSCRPDLLVDEGELRFALGLASDPEVDVHRNLPRNGRDETIHPETHGLWWKDAAKAISDEMKLTTERAAATTFVVISSYKDARRLAGDGMLARYEPELCSVETWSSTSDLDRAAAPPRALKIVHVSWEVNILPRFCSLRTVIAAPYVDDLIFDDNISTFVETKVDFPHKRIMANSIIGREPSSRAIHVFLSEDQTVCRLAKSPAFGREFGYLGCGIFHLCPLREMHKMPMQFPDNGYMLAVCFRNLFVGGFIEKGPSPPGWALMRLTEPLGSGIASLIGLESSLPALVLLSGIRPSMPDTLKQLVVEMAMLLSHGLSSIFETGQASTTRGRLEMVQELAADGWLAARQVYKGQLWLSLAYVHAFRELAGPAVEGRSPLLERMAAEVRPDLVGRVVASVSEWLRRLSVAPVGDMRTAELSEEELLAVDRLLVRALAFNVLFVPPRHDSGYWARGVTTKAFLRNDNEGIVDWRRLRVEVGGGMFAVCTGLNMTVQPGSGRKAYQALGVTAVSAVAVSEVSNQIAPEGEELGPERKYLMSEDEWEAAVASQHK